MNGWNNLEKLTQRVYVPPENWCIGKMYPASPFEAIPFWGQVDFLGDFFFSREETVGGFDV